MPRRAASEDEEMEEAEVKIQDDVVELNGTHLNGLADNPEGLPYDPDQKVEDKRRLRAQYRQLLGEQDGMYASDASILVLIHSQNIAPTWQTSLLAKSWRIKN
jgi:hypothetical protein